MHSYTVPPAAATPPCAPAHDPWPALTRLPALQVCVMVHASWADFMEQFKGEAGLKRLVAYTVYGDTYYGGERPRTPGAARAAAAFAAAKLWPRLARG